MTKQEVVQHIRSQYILATRMRAESLALKATLYELDDAISWNKEQQKAFYKMIARYMQVHQEMADFYQAQDEVMQELQSKEDDRLAIIAGLDRMADKVKSQFKEDFDGTHKE